MLNSQIKRLPQIQVPVLSNPYADALVYGLLYGPIALPCSRSLVVGFFTLSLTAGEALGKLGVLLWFGLGIGLPFWLCPFCRVRASDGSPAGSPGMVA